jgi:hypothetical protein
MKKIKITEETRIGKYMLESGDNIFVETQISNDSKIIFKRYAKEIYNNLLKDHPELAEKDDRYIINTIEHIMDSIKETNANFEKLKKYFPKDYDASLFNNYNTGSESEWWKLDDKQRDNIVKYYKEGSDIKEEKNNLDKSFLRDIKMKQIKITEETRIGNYMFDPGEILYLVEKDEIGAMCKDEINRMDKSECDSGTCAKEEKEKKEDDKKDMGLKEAHEIMTNKQFWEKIEEIRSNYGDTAILNEMLAWLGTAEAKNFYEHFFRMYNLDADSEEGGYEDENIENENIDNMPESTKNKSFIGKIKIEEETKLDKYILDPGDTLFIFKEEKWSGAVDIKKSSTPDIFSTGDAEEIANSTSKKHGGDLGKSIQALSFYINRAGQNLSDERKGVINHAKKILQDRKDKKAD